MKPPVLLATVALLGIGFTACGETGKGTAPKARYNAASDGAIATAASGVMLPQPEFKTDAELDSDSYPGEPDDDNNHVFGRAASAADERAATALVKRYYAAAAAGDGAVGCRLMYSVLAESIPEDYGQLAGTPSGRTTTCAMVMAKLFKHLYKRLNAYGATLKVAAVRVRRNEASVRLGFGGQRPKYYVKLHRERGTWKIDTLLGTEQAIYVE